MPNQTILVSAAAKESIDKLEPALILHKPKFSFDWEEVTLGNSERIDDVVFFNFEGQTYLISRSLLHLLIDKGVLTILVN